MIDIIRRDAALAALDRIYKEIWNVDIPSPTVPEYIEHHEQMKSLMGAVINERRRIQEEANALTCCGYALDDLIRFADACRRQGVDEQDLKVFINNQEAAISTALDGLGRVLNEALGIDSLVRKEGSE